MQENLDPNSGSEMRPQNCGHYLGGRQYPKQKPQKLGDAIIDITEWSQFRPPCLLLKKWCRIMDPLLVPFQISMDANRVSCPQVCSEMHIVWSEL